MTIDFMNVVVNKSLSNTSVDATPFDDTYCQTIPSLPFSSFRFSSETQPAHQQTIKEMMPHEYEFYEHFFTQKPFKYLS